MHKRTFKITALLLSALLIFQQSGFAQAIGMLDISGHLSSMRSSFTQDKFRPLHLRYLSYDALNNSFKLLLDKGDLKNPKPEAIEDTTKTLLNYFFIGLTLPNDKFWVNLRPDSPDNIIDDSLAQTDVGKILLEADLQLKKDTAKYTSPQTPEGREYWNKLYKKAGELFGSENITIPTLTRPWIVPDEVIVTESQDNAYIYKATLKVMLEQDYLKDSAVYNFKDDRLKALNEYSSQLIRELIIPKLTKEINTSKRYAPLRQVYYSLILSQWFKRKFINQNSDYARLIDRNNLTNLTSKKPYSKATYFQAYQKSFKDGEYNTKEPVYTPFGQTIRSYFSGGIALAGISPKPFVSKTGAIPRLPFNLGFRVQGEPGNMRITKDSNSSPSDAQALLSGIVRGEFIVPGLLIIEDNTVFQEVMRIAGQYNPGANFARGVYINKGEIAKTDNARKKELYQRLIQYLEEKLKISVERAVVVSNGSNPVNTRHEVLHDYIEMASQVHRETFASLVGALSWLTQNQEDFNSAYFSITFGSSVVDTREEALKEFVAKFFSLEYAVAIDQEDSYEVRNAKEGYQYILKHTPEDVKRLFYEIGLIWPAQPAAEAAAKSNFQDGQGHKVEKQVSIQEFDAYFSSFERREERRIDSSRMRYMRASLRHQHLADVDKIYVIKAERERTPFIAYRVGEHGVLIVKDLKANERIITEGILDCIGLAFYAQTTQGPIYGIGHLVADDVTIHNLENIFLDFIASFPEDTHQLQVVIYSNDNGSETKKIAEITKLKAALKDRFLSVTIIGQEHQGIIHGTQIMVSADGWVVDRHSLTDALPKRDTEVGVWNKGGSSAFTIPSAKPAGKSSNNRNLPDYRGAGNTSIHVALDEVRRMIGNKDFTKARLLLQELLVDLRAAQKAQGIEPLMDTWNRRYPSSLEVDLLIGDIPVAISDAERILGEAGSRERGVGKITDWLDSLEGQDLERVRKDYQLRLSLFLEHGPVSSREAVGLLTHYDLMIIGSHDFSPASKMPDPNQRRSVSLSRLDFSRSGYPVGDRLLDRIIQNGLGGVFTISGERPHDDLFRPDLSRKDQEEIIRLRLASSALAILSPSEDLPEAILNDFRESPQGPINPFSGVTDEIQVSEERIHQKMLKVTALLIPESVARLIDIKQISRKNGPKIFVVPEDVVIMDQYQSTTGLQSVRLTVRAPNYKNALKQYINDLDPEDRKPLGDLPVLFFHTLRLPTPEEILAHNRINASDHAMMDAKASQKDTDTKSSPKSSSSGDTEETIRGILVAHNLEALPQAVTNILGRLGQGPATQERILQLYAQWQREVQSKGGFARVSLDRARDKRGDEPVQPEQGVEQAIQISRRINNLTENIIEIIDGQEIDWNYAGEQIKCRLKARLNKNRQCAVDVSVFPTEGEIDRHNELIALNTSDRYASEGLEIGSFGLVELRIVWYREKITLLFQEMQPTAGYEKLTKENVSRVRKRYKKWNQQAVSKIMEMARKGLGIESYRAISYDTMLSWFAQKRPTWIDYYGFLEEYPVEEDIEYYAVTSPNSDRLDKKGAHVKLAVLGDYNVTNESGKGGIDGSTPQQGSGQAGSPSIPRQGELGALDASQKALSIDSPTSKQGGIDFRAMPIVTQPVNPLGTVSLGRQGLDMTGTVPVNLDKDWQEIRNMLQAGIIPSSLRIKEYLQNCCGKQDPTQSITKVLSCIAEILRLEEERCSPTDSCLKDILVVLQSGKSAQDLKVALSSIEFFPKEP